MQKEEHEKISCPERDPRTKLLLLLLLFRSVYSTCVYPQREQMQHRKNLITTLMQEPGDVGSCNLPASANSHRLLLLLRKQQWSMYSLSATCCSRIPASGPLKQYPTDAEDELQHDSEQIWRAHVHR